MNSLKLLKKYLVGSQLYVSLMGTLLAVFFMYEEDNIKTPTILLIFITYFSGYLYTKYQGAGLVFYRVLILNIIAGIASAALILYHHNEIRLLKWGIIVLLGLFYNSKFLSFYLREIPLLKIFYVGLTWALINSWLILPDFSLPIFSISWLFVSALVLPFDIRDRSSDTVVTFPRLIGVQKTKYLAYILIFVSLLIAVWQLSPVFAAAYWLTSLLTFILIYFSDEQNNESYFSVLVETCSGFPLLIVILLKYF